MCVHFLYEIYLLLYEMPNHFFPNSVFIYVDGLHNSSHGDSLPMLISNVCGIPVADRLLIRAIQILTPAILLEIIMRTVPPDFSVRLMPVEEEEEEPKRDVTAEICQGMKDWKEYLETGKSDNFVTWEEMMDELRD